MPTLIPNLGAEGLGQLDQRALKRRAVVFSCLRPMEARFDYSQAPRPTLAKGYFIKPTNNNFVITIKFLFF